MDMWLFATLTVLSLGISRAASQEFCSEWKCPPDGPFAVANFTEPGLFTDEVEGPAVDFDGLLHAVNFQQRGNIGQVTRQGVVTELLAFPEGSVGNGIRFNQAGTMFVADTLGRKVLMVNPRTLQIRTLAEDERMSAPNDLAITRNGTLFMSDPIWSEAKGNLWRIDVDGTATLLDEDLGSPNGIEISPDDGTLYVGEYQNNQILAYDLSPTGDVSNKRVFKKFDFEESFQGLDGMRCDVKGYLYVALYGVGAVAKVSPTGEEKMRIPVAGELATNVAFGGHDGCTMYVTIRDTGLIQHFRTDNPGRSFYLWHNRSWRRIRRCLRGRRPLHSLSPSPSPSPSSSPSVRSVPQPPVTVPETVEPSPAAMVTEESDEAPEEELIFDEG